MMAEPAGDLLSKAMKYSLRSLMIVAVMLSLIPCRADAVVTIFLDAPHDDVAVREDVKPMPELSETAYLLFLLQPLAVADRSRQNSYRFPYCYERLTRVQIEKRLGNPVAWKPENYALPCAGNEIVSAQLLPGAKPGNNSAFYELKQVGGILVFFSSDGVAMTEGIVYLSIDDSFVPLKNKNDLPRRLEWETTKMRRLRKWMAIPEDVVKNKKGEFVLDSSTSRQKSSEPADPRIRVLFDYGHMGQME